LLCDPATQVLLTADPRLGPILRPRGWRFEVDRARLPSSRWRPRLVFLPPGGTSTAAQAAAAFAAARSKDFSATDIIALWCLPATCGWDKRPIRRGCAGLTLADGTKNPD